MYVPFSADPLGTTFLQSRASPSTGAVTQPEDFGPLVELEQIGTRRCFNREEEIFAQGDVGDCWYRVVSGTVRICKLLRDGRRHVPNSVLRMTASACLLEARAWSRPKQSAM